MLNHDDDTDGDDDDYGDDADDGDDDGDVNFQFVFDMFVLKWPFRVITLFLLIRFCVSMSYITCCLCICWCFAVSSFCWIFNLGFHVFAVFSITYSCLPNVWCSSPHPAELLKKRRASKNTWVEGWRVRWRCKARMLETRTSRILDRGFKRSRQRDPTKRHHSRVLNELTQWRTKEIM